MNGSRWPQLYEAFGLGVAVAMAAVTAAYFIAYQCALSVTACLVIGLLAGITVTVGVVKLAQNTWTTDEFHVPYAHTPSWVYACLICPTSVIIMSVLDAFRTPFGGWDGWSIWAFKAEAFASGGFTLPYFHNPESLQTHPDYPLNVPIAESFFLHVPQQLGPALATLLGPLSLVALLMIVYSGVYRVSGSTVAIVVTSVLSALPSWIDSASSGAADVPMALYIGAAVVYFRLWLLSNSFPFALLSALLAGGAVWTKKEGVLFAALLLLAIVVISLIRTQNAKRKLRDIAFILALFAMIPAGWFYFVAVHQPFTRDFDPLVIQTVGRHADRLLPVADLMSRAMAMLSNWSLLWPTILVVILINWRRTSKATIVVGSIVLLQLVAYVVLFEFSNWTVYLEHAATSLDRLLLQLAPAAVVLLWSAIDDQVADGTRQTFGSNPNPGSSLAGRPIAWANDCADDGRPALS